MVLKRAESFPCIPLNVFFSFNILIGCYSTNIWMNRIIPSLRGPHSSMKTILVLAPSRFHMLSTVVQVHQNPIKIWQQREDIYRWRAPRVRAEAAFDLSYSVAVWTVGPHSAAASSGVFGSPPPWDCDGLWSCNTLAVRPAGPAAPEQPWYLLLNPQLCTEDEKRIAWNLVTVIITYTVCNI